LEPVATEAVAGVTKIRINVAAVTVKVVEPDLLVSQVPQSRVAVIVVVPTDRPVAMPGDTIVATPVALEVQITLLLMS
jgi:hypothetical protein